VSLRGAKAHAAQGCADAAEQRGELVILQKPIAGLSEAGLERFLLRARRAAGVKGAVNLLVTSSAEVRSLNRTFRGMNKETDVLSFPADSGGQARGPRMAGEVAISADVAKRSAARLGHSAADEVKILALHGILHLAGFDHEHDNGEMERKERRLQVALRLPTGLIERVAGLSPRLKSGLRTAQSSRRTYIRKRAEAQRSS
jgi:probable rRNA maturation factor